ncbi:unnamed protein product [Schistosoma mattheei]|uniref:Uncharacterized protein n=1 Tax=Schistosoma mattheei TaxID=31246 RepID=A0A183PT85_9TREM|nr:unnamed protein product [Schistosoma mattheei]
MDDEDESDLVAKQVKVDWDDEEDNAVPDSWDAEPPKNSETTKTVAPAKLSLSERLKLKEEQKRKEREEKLRREEELRLSQPVTELQREKLAEEAELGLLKDTFVEVDALRTVNTVINALINEKQKLVKVRNNKYFTF